LQRAIPPLHLPKNTQKVYCVQAGASWRCLGAQSLVCIGSLPYRRGVRRGRSPLARFPVARISGPHGGALLLSYLSALIPSIASMRSSNLSYSLSRIFRAFLWAFHIPKMASIWGMNKSEHNAAMKLKNASFAAMALFVVIVSI